MKLKVSNENFAGTAWVIRGFVLAGLCASILVAQQPSAKVAAPASAAAAANVGGKTFSTPELAADALISAADTFNETALVQIFGPNGIDIVFTGEIAQDRKRAADFAAKAHEKKKVTIEPKNVTRAFLQVGEEDWPFPVPMVKRGGRWSFDSDAGRKELLNRRIGANEIDAIEICHGYVEAQEAYAFQVREGYDVNQYAQRIISTPGTQDGLTWKNADGTWGGPIGEKIAEAIAAGYTNKEEPYHGYYFKVLKGQGPAAPLGELDYVIKGAMIGGFALVAAPAEYRVTGVNTFIVSQSGVVYQKDFGPATLEQFKKMDRFNPDKTWTPVPDDQENINIASVDQQP